MTWQLLYACSRVELGRQGVVCGTPTTSPLWCVQVCSNIYKHNGLWHVLEGDKRIIWCLHNLSLVSAPPCTRWTAMSVQPLRWFLGQVQGGKRAELDVNKKLPKHRLEEPLQGAVAAARAAALFQHRLHLHLHQSGTRLCPRQLHVASL